MAQLQPKRHFRYRTVQIIKSAPLGVGSYGAVYRAKCDELPCAAKIIHPTLFEDNDPGAQKIMDRFDKERDFLSSIRHPHVVQYLGTSRDPKSNLPVLLMELLDGNLTRYLEESREPLPYHVQLNISYDIALALAYLHLNDIIHRDLSSNNVLLIAGSRAKVTDFGMSKFTDTNPRMTPLTMCPGTMVYMSPEALKEPPVYTDKLDCFSLGVLTVQVMTRQFPNPGARTHTVIDTRSPTGRTEMPVLETERRKSHIDLIDPTHPLLPIATDCLSYGEEDRPSAQELCHRLAALKEAPQYCESVERSTLQQQEIAERRDRERRSLTRELDELRRDSQEQADRRNTLECKVRELSSQLEANEQVTAKFQESLLLREKVIQDQQKSLAAKDKQIQHLVEQLREVSLRGVNGASVHPTEKKDEWGEAGTVVSPAEGGTVARPAGSIQLCWTEERRAPESMSGGAAVVDGRVAYFNPHGQDTVYMYNSPTEQWLPLKPCSKTDFALAVVNGLLTAVGGTQSGEATTTLHCYTWEGRGNRWFEMFPPMPTGRRGAAAVCSLNSLIVAGGTTMGSHHDNLATVEMMDTETLQWSTANSLPHPFAYASATICGDRLYMLGGFDQNGRTKSVLTCSLSLLSCTGQSPSRGVRSKTTPPLADVWQSIASLPVYGSTCATVNKHLLAVGGMDVRGESTKNVYNYNPTTDSWDIVSCMATARFDCLVAVLPGNDVMVVGGGTDSGPTGLIATSAVEIAHY